jgi:DNA-directed RNA polymerase sigma subunit (sigma70/sigma32)
VFSEETEPVEALRTSLEAIGREPLLTKEEEIELALQIEHCREAEEALREDAKLSAGVTRERVRQIERDALRKLRQEARLIA